MSFKIKKRFGAVAILLMSLIVSGCGGGGSSTPAETPPTAGVVATPSTITITENSTGTFDVVLKTEPTADVSISVSSADLSEAETDIASLTFTNSTGSSPWDVPQTVTVSGLIDDTADGNQTIDIVLGVPTTTDTIYSALAASNVAVTVSDIDTAGFTVSVATLSTAENGANVNYTVVLNTEPDGDVVIDIASADISEGTVTPAALTFNATNWNTAQTVTVTPVDDLIADGNLTYNVIMIVNTGSTTDATGYAVLALSPVAVTNSDNDAAGFTVSATTLSTIENGAAETYTLALNTQPDGDVVVNVASSDLSEGTVAPATLTFDATNWNTAQPVTMTPVDDLIADGNQTYDVTMTVDTVNSTDSTGYAALTLAPVAVTNNDDDTAGFSVSIATLSTTENGGTATYTVALNAMPDGNVVVNVASSDISEGTVAPATLTFNATNWNTAQTVTVTPVDDLIADGNQTYDVTMTVDAATTDSTGYAVLTLAPVAVTNNDDDTAGFSVSTAILSTTENGGTATYTVALNTMPDGDVVVNVASSDLSEGTVAPATLAFDATNWNTAQTVTVTPVDDLIADGNPTYDVSMTVDAVNSTDSTGYAALTLAPVAVTNNDDDTAGFTVSTTNLNTSEGGATASYELVLATEPNGTVEIYVASSDSSEGSVSPFLITFDATNWQTPQTVTVTPQEDLIADGNVAYTINNTINLTGTADTTGYADLAGVVVDVTNGDNDTAGFTVSATTLSTTENGFTASYTVALNTEPSDTVLVDVTSLNLNEGTVSPATLSFDATNWSTPQTVTVTPVDDFVDDGAQLYDVTMVVDAINSLDTTGYAALTLTSIAVTNNDDDYIGLNTSVWSVSTVENGANVTYTIALNTVPNGDVVLNLSALDSATWGLSDEFTVSPATMTFTSTDWSTAQTVTVTPLDDLIVDGTVMDYIVTAGDATNTTDSTGYASLTNYLAEYNADDDVVEGTLVSPMVLVFGTTDLPKSGGVDTTSSYYEVTGLTAGATYSVSITGMTDDVGLSVYDDSGQTSFLCSDLNAGTVDKACDATPSGTSLWINVDGGFTTAGATYTLNAVIPPLVPNYISSNTPLALVDSGTLTDTLTIVSGAPGSLAQVEVLVNLTHTWDSDLVITLISPAGTPVILSSNNGGSGDNYTNTTFSGSAATAVTAGAAPFSGWYIPEVALSDLNLEDGNGTWSLEIDDQAGGDTGELLSWGIKLQ